MLKTAFRATSIALTNTDAMTRSRPWRGGRRGAEIALPMWLGLVMVVGLAKAAEFEVDREGAHDPELTKLYFRLGGRLVSPWHDVPFQAGEDDDGTPLLHFVCEIPRGTTAKFEIHKSEPFNPVIQDRKKGKLRFYQYGPSLVNYGAIAQTWEDPAVPHPDTGFGGDNDPIDVLQINPAPCDSGAVQVVRVLGCLALVDDDETDWKLIVADVADPSTSALRDIRDVPVEQVNEMREWFRNYKTAEGKGLNKFGLDEQAMDKAYALRVAHETHVAWQELVAGQAACEFNGTPCWLRDAAETHGEL